MCNKWSTIALAILGSLETQLLAYVQMRGQQALRSDEVATALGISAAQARELLSRLTRKKMIARVRRGLYLLPSRIPPGGRWSPGEYLALATLMQDRQASYQISGAAAFHRYGWDEQVPNRLDVYNTAISGSRQIGAASFLLIKVEHERLGDTDVVRTPGGVDAVYSSRSRSLVDGVYDWIRQELERDQRIANKIVKSAILYGNTGAIRRIGRLLEDEGASQRLLRKLEAELPPTTALIPWCPTRAKRGRVDRRWGVVVND